MTSESLAPAGVHIGTAGWSIPRASAASCPGEGSHLQRYARVLRGAEINSSFHRPHAASTYEKWAACAPRGFRFAVKLPRAITHDARLRRARPAFEQFLGETSGLGRARAPLLVQLPPSHEFDRRVVSRFFAMMRDVFDGLLRDFRVARVAADPLPAEGAGKPGGWPGLIYYRLHGSPRKYWSRYSEAFLAHIAGELTSAPRGADGWCIFDNTASGAALANALELQTIISGVPSRDGARMGK